MKKEIHVKKIAPKVLPRLKNASTADLRFANSLQNSTQVVSSRVGKKCAPIDGN